MHVHIGIASTLVSVEQQRGPKQMVLGRNNVAQTFMGFKFRERDPNPHGQSAIISELAARNWSPPLPKRSICSKILQTEANATARGYARCPERSVEELLGRKSFASFGAPRGGTTMLPGRWRRHVSFTRSTRCQAFPSALVFRYWTVGRPPQPQLSRSTSIAPRAHRIGGQYEFHFFLSLVGRARGVTTPRDPLLVEPTNGQRSGHRRRVGSLP